MAVRFDGSTDKLSRSAAGLGGFDYSVCCWVNLASDRNNYSAFIDIDGAFGQVFMGTGVDGTQHRLVGTAEVAGATLTVGAWYFVGLNYTVASGSNNVLYSGAIGAAGLTATTGGSNDAIADAGTFYIGNDGFADWLDGRVENVKVWTAALTAVEMERERYSYAPARTTGLWAWYPLDGNETIDYSGNGRTLTAAGTPVDDHGPPLSYGGSILVADVVGGGAPVNYDETGLAISITATVTGVDQLGYVDALAITVTSTVTEADLYSFNENVAITASSTVTETDQADFNDDLSTTVTATVSGVSQADFNDDLAVTVTSTVTEADQYGRVDALAVSVSSSVTEVDQLGFVEARSITVAATVTLLDQYGHIDLLAITVAATVTSTALLHLHESPAITTAATITIPVDQADFNDTPAQVTIAATVTVLDESGGAFNETGRSVGATATVSAADTAAYNDLTASQAITSTVTLTTQYGGVEVLIVTPTATILLTEHAVYHDPTFIGIEATVAALEQVPDVTDPHPISIDHQESTIEVHFAPGNVTYRDTVTQIGYTEG